MYSFPGGALHSCRCAELNLCKNKEGFKCSHAMERGQKACGISKKLLHVALLNAAISDFRDVWLWHILKESGWRITDSRRVKPRPVLPKSPCTLPSHVLVARHVNSCSVTGVPKTAFPSALLDSPVLTMCLLFSKGKGAASHWRNVCWVACAQHLGWNCV